MKCMKKQKGLSRSRNYSAVSFDSTKSPVELDKNVELVTQACKANMDNVSDKLKNERENKKMQDPYILMNSKLSSNIEPNHTSLKLAEQELFLSNLKMGTTATVEALKMKLKPKSTLKKTEPVQDSKHCSLSPKFSKQTAKLKKNRADEVTLVGKCMIQNKDDWNKYMLGKVKSPKDKISKSCKEISNAENSIENNDAELNTIELTDTSKLNNELLNTEKEQIDSNSSKNSKKTTVANQAINSLDSSSKAKKSRIQKISNNSDDILLNIENTDQEIDHSETCVQKIKISKKNKKNNSTESAYNNIDNTGDQIINSSPKIKKSKIPKFCNITDISHNIESEEMTNEIINTSCNSSPKSKKCGTRKLNKSVKTTDNIDQRTKKIKGKTNSDDNLKLPQDQTLPDEMNLLINDCSMLSVELTDVLEDFTNENNSEEKSRNSITRKYSTRSTESDKKISRRKRKISDTSNIEKTEDYTGQEINTNIKKVYKNSLIDNNFTSTNAVDERNLDTSKNTSQKSTVRINYRQRTRLQTSNSCTEEISAVESQENSDISLNSDVNQMNNCSENHSPMASNFNCSEATKSNLAFSEENLLIFKNTKLMNDNSKSSFKTNLEIQKTCVTPEVTDTEIENGDIVDIEQESHEKDIFEELRKKYSVMLNCDLNPSVRLKKLVNARNGTQDQSEISIKHDPEDSLVDSSDSTFIKIEEINPLISSMQLRNARVVLHNFKLEKQHRAIINLNRNWNFSKAKHHPRSGFKYKIASDLVSITSRNYVFCGAQLVEGINDSPLLLNVNKIVRNETLDKTDHFSNEEKNTNLLINENDCIRENSTLDYNLENKDTIIKISSISNDKINLTGNEIRIKSPQNLNNELKNLEKNKTACDKKLNDSLSINEKIKCISKEKSINMETFEKSKKEKKEKTHIKIVQTSDTKIKEKLLTQDNDFKQKNIQQESLMNNKNSDKKYKHIKTNKNQNLEKSPVKSKESIKKSVCEQLSTVISKIENKKNDTKYENKNDFDATMEPSVEISQDKITSGKEYDVPKNVEYTAMKIPSSPNKHLPLVSPCGTPRQKHVFKFEKCDIKRPPSRLARKVKLNRPTLTTFKVPFSPSSQSIKSDVTSLLSSRKLYKGSSQTVSSESNFGVSPKKCEREFDSISIYADTIGVESVADATSVKYDSDGDNDFNIDLISILQENEVKHTDVNKWVENTVCEIQKQTNQDMELLDNLNELSTFEEMESNKFGEQIQKDISNELSSTRTEVKLEEKKVESVQHIDEVSADSNRSLISYNMTDKYQGVDIFRYMCISIKRRGECNKKSCQFKHEFPPEWKNELKNSPIESILALYDNAKENHVFLFKKIFSTITEYLGDKRDFNNLIKMVKDVLEIDMNSDRAPFINHIINGLCKTGVTFQSIVEVVYKNANVHENLINLLSDILLNLTVEKGDSNGNWPIIKELIQNRNYDIDSGIIQSIIIESLENDISEKVLIARVYHDLIKKISNKKLNSIFESLLNNFYNRLVKYNLISEANEFFARCHSLNITLGNKSDHSDPPSPVVCSPVGKNISKVPPFHKTPKIEPKFENVSPVGTPTNVNFVSPINRSLPLLNSCVENSVSYSSLTPLFPFPPPRLPPPSLPPPSLPPPSLPPPSLPPPLFTKPPPQSFKQKPVVNQKMPWYVPKARSRHKQLFNPDQSGPSTSGIPYSSVSPNLPQQNKILNKEEVKRAVCEENVSVLLSLIMKFKDNNFIDVFIKTSIEAMLESNHSFPTFFGNLCQAAKFLNSKDKALEYVFKTIGLNIILHLTQLSNWDQAYIVYKILRSNFEDDLYNVKLYLPEKYTYLKRILIISLIHIKKFQFDFAWSLLRENAVQYDSLWQSENNVSEITCRNSIIDELLTSVTKKKLWHLGLNIVQHLLKNNISGVDVKKYINDILLLAINKKCNINDIIKFVNCSTNWFNYVSKHIFRAIVAHTVTMSCWSLAKSFYVIGSNFEIYPQLFGNERCLSFSIHYIFEEIQLMLDIFFENMIRFRPIKHNIMIRVTDETQMIPTSELPAILQQYQMSATTMQVRITNILNNFIKPAITINKQNNIIVITTEVINRHLEGRLNNSKARLDT